MSFPVCCPSLSTLRQVGDAAVQMTGATRIIREKVNQSLFFNGSISVCRGDIALALLNKAATCSNVRVHCGEKFTSVDLDKRYV